MKKPAQRRRSSRSSFKKIKITKFHIIIMSALILSVFVGLASSIVYIYKRDQISQPRLIEPNSTIVVQNTTTPPISEVLNQTSAENQTTYVPTPIITRGKPKLVIIIDDVINEAQLKNIEAIPLKITPSFLPPKSTAPRSSELAVGVKFYMVHLPMEALDYGLEPVTLKADDSYDEILRKLKLFKKQFPRAIYYNNHTGSKFTASLEAMQKLYIAMDELGLVFVDSRTTAHTKAPEVAGYLNKKLLQRDVFLDNEINAPAIEHQLELAIKKAKERGYAVAIGHPHKETLLTLKNSIHLLDGVDVVYPKDLL